MASKRKPNTKTVALQVQLPPRRRASDGAEMRQTTVHLPRELLREIAVHCAAQETTFSAETERLWTDYLIAQARKAG